MSKEKTLEHKILVGKFMNIVIKELIDRSLDHDNSKCENPEVELFDIMSPKLAGCTYDSLEYKKFLEELKPALDHHYANNRHHPEHFANGISDMNLIDLIEMICDWKASTLRHNDGNILKSIDINQNRFKYTNELNTILKNTVQLFE